MKRSRLSLEIIESQKRKAFRSWKSKYARKRVNNPRNVLELAAGERGRKIVDLALRHPMIKFAAIDHLSVGYKEYLRSKGINKVPNNLSVIEYRDVLDHLLRSKSNYFDHVYSHFLLQHLSYAKRIAVCEELMRVLKPGTRFVTVEQYHTSRQIPLELEQAGFRVSVKPVGIQQIANLGTDSGDLNAARAVHTERRLASARAYGGKEFEDAEKNSMLQGGWWQMMETARDNGDLNSPEGKKALQTMMEDEERQFTHSHFYVITAFKPKKPTPIIITQGRKSGIITPTKEEIKKYGR